jgi:hypothetical protein
MNIIAGRQPNAVLPSRSCCCVCYPRISEKTMLHVQSSIGASVMVAVTTTPLEIVKTRLQIAPANFHQKSKGPLFPNRMSSHGKDGNRMLPMNLSSLDSAKYHRPGPLNVIKTILKQKGISGLWTGTGAAIIHAVPSVSIYLVCYEQLKAKFEEIKTPSALTPVLAGALSRSISVLITVSAEFFVSVSFGLLTGFSLSVSARFGADAQDGCRFRHTKRCWLTCQVGGRQKNGCNLRDAADCR